MLSVSFQVKSGLFVAQYHINGSEGFTGPQNNAKLSVKTRKNSLINLIV